MKLPKYNWTFGSERSAVRICFTDSPAPMKPHSQKELELMYFYETEGCLYYCEGIEHALSAGQLAVVNPFKLHACAQWGKGCVAACVIIDLHALSLPALSRVEFKNTVSDPETKQIFDRIQSVLSDVCDPIRRDCLVLSSVYELLALLSKHTRAVEGSCRSERESDLRSVAQYISDHRSEALRIDDLARQIHLSEDRFSHAFKEFFGVSPTEYILGERIALACERLRDTSDTVTEIAHACGFCTASYFGEQFKKRMKLSPRQYRDFFQSSISHQDII